MVADVLEEHERRLDFADDPGDVGPEVPGVVFTSLFAGDAEGSAGITSNDAMNAATPRLAVEGFEIAP